MARLCCDLRLMVHITKVVRDTICVIRTTIAWDWVDQTPTPSRFPPNPRLIRCCRSFAPGCRGRRFRDGIRSSYQPSHFDSATCCDATSSPCRKVIALHDSPENASQSPSLFPRMYSPLLLQSMPSRLTLIPQKYTVQIIDKSLENRYVYYKNIL